MTAAKVAPALKLRTAKPITKIEIPVVEKGGPVRKLDEFADLVTIAQYVKENGVGSYEAFDVADLEAIRKRDPKLAKMKTLVTSFVMAARKVLKQFQVEKKLHLVVRKERIYLESME